MHWWRYWPEFLQLLVFLYIALEAPNWNRHSFAGGLVEAAQWTSGRKLYAREQTRDLWYHGFNNYMNHAFPLDELSPLSCTGKGPDWEHPDNIARNDVAGNFSLTLIDVLDTLVILDDRPGFETAVRNVIDWVSFDVNTKPQVFETTIRVLGGLLSAHTFANQSGHPFHLPWYRGELLTMAHDLGERLLPAFATPTGLPFARLNLRKGVSWAESPDTCTAGAGSLMLEFATLSRLTGDERFEKAAYKAFFALWNRKSDIGLVGNTINIYSGKWLYPEVTGIGAGVDSFYEYAFKWYVLSGEVEFLDVWQESYAAIMRYARSTDGFWFRNVNIHTGDTAFFSVDSLSAFWPGLQVLAGDVQNAIKSHLMYWNLWRAHSGLPEVWDIKYKTATALQYPLRPEFVESTWYLYRATRDPFYLDVAERILFDIIYRCKVECGLTGIKDLKANARDDRMESFALSETLKYLFLLFDEANPLHSDDSNYVFTTEGHIISLPSKHLRPMSAARRKLRRVENHQCPAYEPFVHAFDGWGDGLGLIQGVRGRADIDYSRELISLLPQKADENMWSAYGWCERPKVDLYSYNFVLSADGTVVPEDENPSTQKLEHVSDGFVMHNITGIRTHIVSRLDGQGYDITKLGPHAVRTGQVVYVNDSVLQKGFSNKGAHAPTQTLLRDPTVSLRLFTSAPDLTVQLNTGAPDHSPELLVTAYTALFGGDLTPRNAIPDRPLSFGHGEGVRLIRVPENEYGCARYTSLYPGDALLVRRGHCTFLEKLVAAQLAGASGVVVLSDEDEGINPSATEADLAMVGDVSDVVAVVITKETGESVLELMESAERHGAGHVVLALEPEPDGYVGESSPEDGQSREGSQGDVHAHRVLYLNGHPLLNTRLLL